MQGFRWCTSTGDRSSEAGTPFAGLPHRGRPCDEAAEDLSDLAHRTLQAPHLHKAEAQLLAAVPARQVAHNVVIVVLDDAQDDVTGGHAVCTLRLLELA